MRTQCTFSTQAKMCQEYVREIIFINVYKMCRYGAPNDAPNDAPNTTNDAPNS